MDKTSLIIKNKLYCFDLLRSEKTLIINIFKDNKFIELKKINMEFDLIRNTFFNYEDKIYCVILDRNNGDYSNYKVISIDLETYNTSLEYSFIKEYFHSYHKNCFVMGADITFTLAILDCKNWKWNYIKLPMTIINSFSVTDDYVVIYGVDKLYQINKNLEDKNFKIKKIDNKISLFGKSTYKNYIVYKNVFNHDIYIYNVKLMQIHKITNIIKSRTLIYNYKLLYFDFNFMKFVNVKIFDLPISNLFEKCVYWVDENKFPEIAKKRIINYREDYLILI